jgi:alkane 1-monooxygenase
VRPLSFALPFLFLGSAPLGFLLGGPWAWATVALLPVTLLSFDWILGMGDGAPARPQALAYRALPWLYIVAQLAVIGWAAQAVAGAAWPDAVGLTLSVGLSAGIFGMLTAHEMVHSRSRAERGLGLLMLAGVGYMQFRIAHIHGHHRRAATPEDAATARRGESAYGFVVRSVAGQAREAWAFETRRLAARGRGAFHPANRMLLYVGVEVLVAAGVGWLFGPAGLAFWAAQALLAIIMLELFNYIAHYGLMRRAGADGRLERLSGRHSWNSSRRMNNWALFNMGRHSDHHRRPTAAYQRLEVEAGAPELPTGYAGAILLALAPPLWRAVMDQRVDRWMGEPQPDRQAVETTGPARVRP